MSSPWRYSLKIFSSATDMKIPSLQGYTYYLLRALRHESQLPIGFYNIVLSSMATIPKPSTSEKIFYISGDIFMLLRTCLMLFINRFQNVHWWNLKVGAFTRGTGSKGWVANKQYTGHTGPCHFLKMGAEENDSCWRAGRNSRTHWHEVWALVLWVGPTGRVVKHELTR